MITYSSTYMNIVRTPLCACEEDAQTVSTNLVKRLVGADDHLGLVGMDPHKLLGLGDPRVSDGPARQNHTMSPACRDTTSMTAYGYTEGNTLWTRAGRYDQNIISRYRSFVIPITIYITI